MVMGEKIMKRLLLMATVLSCLSFTSLVQAETAAAREEILAWIEQIMSDPIALKSVVEKGRERTRICSQCHGVDGNSKSPEIPNLAEQNPAYIVEQVEHFKTGVRKNFVMSGLAKDLGFEDKINIAIYFSQQKLKPVEADASKVAVGKSIFQRVCQTCHGMDGKGQEGYAHLAGQNPLYVMNTLKNFRAIARGQNSSGGAKRRSPQMEQVAASLSDADIESLANYIALLK